MRTLLVLALLSACAGDDRPGTRPIRPGGDTDLGVVIPDGHRPPADAQPAADASPDAGPRPDALPTPTPEVWFVQHHDAVETGLRARLEPAHGPAGDAITATAPAPLLVRWAGPDSPGASALRRAHDRGRRAAPLYEMTDRADAAESDGSWLAARALAHPNALRVEGRPVLAVQPAPDRAGLTALRNRLADLPIQPFLVLSMDIADRPWPAADAIIPRYPYGLPLPPASTPAQAQDADRRRAARQAALDAGWRWLPRAGPPANGRLDRPDAPVIHAPRDADLTRSLILARQGVAPTLPVVIVDGLGAWRDDRQLDPVDGETTRSPVALTGGLDHEAYGMRRLDAVRIILGPPTNALPELIGSPPILLRYAGPTRPTIDVMPTGLRVTPGDQAHAEWLLAAAPFRLPPTAHLTYARDDRGLRIELVFDDGTRLHDLLPMPEEVSPVSIDLAAFAGRVVQAVVLVAHVAGGVEEPALR